MNTVLAHVVANGKRRLLRLGFDVLCLAVVIVKPDLLLRRPHVARTDLLEGFFNARVAHPHCLYRVRGK